MNRADVARLLTYAASFDRRKLGEADVLAWHDVLADLDPIEAATAVRQHYAESREFLMPADVRRRVLDARRLAAEREHHQHVRQLNQTAQQLAPLTGQGIRTVAQALNAARADRPERAEPEQRWSARRVACPHCRAAPGQACVNPTTERPLTKALAHPARIEAAEKETR